jgi:choline-glycine betaine transporter
LAEPQRPTTSTQDGKDFLTLGHELFELVVAYFKQQTVDPLKALLRFVAFGLTGAVCLSLGAVLIGVGGLRAIQRETNNHLTDDLSWVPYLIVVLFCVIVAGLAVSRIGKVPRGRAR